MKRFGGLWDEITSFENLLLAARKAARGKRFRPATALFNLNLEKELPALQAALRSHEYRPAPPVQFTIIDRKPRLITAAAYCDRVVHHALCNVVEPIFERTFIYDSYACRKGKGQHAACDRYTEFARRNRYVLKCDVRKYFASIDHEILKALLRRKVKDADALWLLDLVIDTSAPQEEVLDYFPGDDLFAPSIRRKGIPVGNLTSQFFANVYLSGFDHWMQETMGCAAYIRYADDFVVFADDKASLHAVRDAAAGRLQLLRLTLHPRKWQVAPVTEGLEFLGYRIFPDRRRLRAGNAIAFRRRLAAASRRYGCGRVTLAEVHPSVRAWVAHAEHADTYRLREAIFDEVKFRRGAGLRREGASP